MLVRLEVEVLAALGAQAGAVIPAQDLGGHGQRQRVARPRLEVELLVVEGRGFAVHLAGSPLVLVARDDAVAADLMWSCFAAARPGATVHVDFLTAGQDWAVRTGLAAGLVLSPDGPLYTRGDLGPLRPWIPSGALL